MIWIFWCYVCVVPTQYVCCGVWYLSGSFLSVCPSIVFVCIEFSCISVLFPVYSYLYSDLYGLQLRGMWVIVLFFLGSFSAVSLFFCAYLFTVFLSYHHVLLCLFIHERSVDLWSIVDVPCHFLCRWVCCIPNVCICVVGPQPCSVCRVWWWIHVLFLMCLPRICVGACGSHIQVLSDWRTWLSIF